MATQSHRTPRYSAGEIKKLWMKTKPCSWEVALYTRCST